MADELQYAYMLTVANCTEARIRHAETHYDVAVLFTHFRSTV
jgi:hypothetical protein